MWQAWVADAGRGPESDDVMTFDSEAEARLWLLEVMRVFSERDDSWAPARAVLASQPSGVPVLMFVPARGLRWEVAAEEV